MWFLFTELYQQVLLPLLGAVKDEGLLQALRRSSGEATGGWELIAAMSFFIGVIMHAFAQKNAPLLRRGGLAPEAIVFGLVSLTACAVRVFLLGAALMRFLAGLVPAGPALPALVAYPWRLLGWWVHLLGALGCVAASLLPFYVLFWEAFVRCDGWWRWYRRLHPANADLCVRVSRAAAAGNAGALEAIKDEVHRYQEMRDEKADKEKARVTKTFGEAAAESMLPAFERMREAPPGDGPDDWVDAVNPVSGWRPLHDAVFAPTPAAARWLLAAGADPDALSVFGKCGTDLLMTSAISPLLLACQLGNGDAARALCEAGADVNLRSGAALQAPAHAAAAEGDWDTLALLMAHGAELNALDDAGLSVADEVGASKLRERLARQQHPRVEDKTD
uniref:Uncharacterized protein n=1 Tax=Phaeomonas parva TaxID=124430 RepID=A0A7S1XWI4_9STRA|mmetsp:Transcript_3911/g.11328  ORF Transcript_3911/g.11328 Transcript_3911/m.11328 type:complete len:391 (+) Transcript_3911:322-1494(+)